jgi:anti-sigma B factor antagonist
MPAEDYTLRQVEDCLIVRLDVDNLLHVTDVNRIGGKLDALVKDQTNNLVLDLSRIRYAGSAALGMLLSLSKTLQQHGGRLVLCGTQHLDTLFRVSRTVAVFDVAPDADAAVQMAKTKK